MSISREALCRKYNFKDIRVATWRDPYSAYAPTSKHKPGASIVAADAYQRAYIPKYRLIVPSPQIPQTTDDEDSDAEDAGPEPVAPTSAPSAAEGPVDVQPESVQDTPTGAAAAEADQTLTSVEDASPPVADLTAISTVDAAAKSTPPADMQPSDAAGIDSIPSLDDILNDISIGPPPTQEPDVLLAAAEVITVPFEVPVFQVESVKAVEELMAQDKSASPLDDGPPPELVPDLISDFDAKVSDEQSCGESTVPDSAAAALINDSAIEDVNNIGGAPAVADINIAALLDVIPGPAPSSSNAVPADPLADFLDSMLGSTTAVEDEVGSEETAFTTTQAPEPALDDLLASIVKAVPADAGSTDLSSVIKTQPEQVSLEPIDADLMALLDASLGPAAPVPIAEDALAETPATPVLDNASLCSDDKHVSFAPDTPEPKETKRKKKSPKEKDAKKSKRRSSLVAAEKPSIDLSRVLEEVSPAAIVPTAAVVEEESGGVSTDAAAGQAVPAMVEDAIEPQGDQKPEQAMTKTKAPKTASKKPSSSKSKSAPKTIGLLAAGALLFGASKSKPTKTSSKEKDKKKSSENKKMTVKDNLETKETARSADPTEPLGAVLTSQSELQEVAAAASLNDTAPDAVVHDHSLVTSELGAALSDLNADVLAGLGISLQGPSDGTSSEGSPPALPVPLVEPVVTAVETSRTDEDAPTKTEDLQLQNTIIAEDSAELPSITDEADFMLHSSESVQDASSATPLTANFDDMLAELLNTPVAVPRGEHINAVPLNQPAVKAVAYDSLQADHSVAERTLTLSDSKIEADALSANSLDLEDQADVDNVAPQAEAVFPEDSELQKLLSANPVEVAEAHESIEPDMSFINAELPSTHVEAVEQSAVSIPEPDTAPTPAMELEEARDFCGRELSPVDVPQDNGLHEESQDTLTQHAPSLDVTSMHSDADTVQQEPEGTSKNADSVTAALTACTSILVGDNPDSDAFNIKAADGEVEQSPELASEEYPAVESDDSLLSAPDDSQFSMQDADVRPEVAKPISASGNDFPDLASDLDQGTEIQSATIDVAEIMDEATQAVSQSSPAVLPLTDDQASAKIELLACESLGDLDDTADIQDADPRASSEPFIDQRTARTPSPELDYVDRVSKEIRTDEALIIEIAPEAAAPSSMPSPDRPSRSDDSSSNKAPSGLPGMTIDTTQLARLRHGERRREHRPGRRTSPIDDDEERRRRRRARRAIEEATSIEVRRSEIDKGPRSRRRTSHRVEDDRSTHDGDRRRRVRRLTAENETGSSEPFKTQTIVPTLLRAFTGSSISSRDALTLDTRPTERRSLRSDDATSPTSVRSHRRERRDSVISKKVSPIIAEAPETAIVEEITPSDHISGDKAGEKSRSRDDDRERRRRHRRRDSEGHRSERMVEDARSDRLKSSRVSDEIRRRRTSEVPVRKPASSSSSQGILSFFSKAR